jgi:hypothetical protein
MSAAAEAVHQTVRVKAVYAHLDSLLTGIDRLKRAGINGFDVMAPLPRHEIQEILYEGRPSPVRWWTLTGALSGMTSGLLLASLSHLAWPMINPAGKPSVSLPPFAIIMFDSTILAGALFTLTGLFVHSGLPAWFLDRAVRDPRFTDDKFGIVFTGAAESDKARLVDMLQKSGAIEVTTGDDTLYEVPNV